MGLIITSINCSFTYNFYLLSEPLIFRIWNIFAYNGIKLRTKSQCLQTSNLYIIRTSSALSKLCFLWCSNASRIPSTIQIRNKLPVWKMEEFILFISFLFSVLGVFLSIAWNNQTNEGTAFGQLSKKRALPKSNFANFGSPLSSNRLSQTPSPVVPSPALPRNVSKAPRTVTPIPEKGFEFVKSCGAIAKAIPRAAWKAVGGRKLKFLYRSKVQFIVSNSSLQSMEIVRKWLWEEHGYKTEDPQKRTYRNILSPFRGLSVCQCACNVMTYEFTAEKELEDGPVLKLGLKFIPRGADSCEINLVLYGGRKHPPLIFQFLLLAESALEFLSPTRCKYSFPDGCSVPVGLLI